MPTGKSMHYVSGGDRLPPLTPVVYGDPPPKTTGLNWPHAEQNGLQEPQPMPTSLIAHTEQPRAAYRGRHPAARTMVRLYVDDGLTAPQVAERLGISAKTVRIHLKRAGVKLRDDRTGQNLPRQP
jgi:DNA-directed RNA polymerase specialized sigma24 family protein